jgi:hypothetical protein
MPRERRGREHLKPFKDMVWHKLCQIEVKRMRGRTKLFWNKSSPNSKISSINLKSLGHLRKNQFSCLTSSCFKISTEIEILLQTTMRTLRKTVKLQMDNLPRNKKTTHLSLTKLDRTFKYNIGFQPSHNGYRSLLIQKNNHRIQCSLSVRTLNKCSISLKRLTLSQTQLLLTRLNRLRKEQLPIFLES